MTVASQSSNVTKPVTVPQVVLNIATAAAAPQQVGSYQTPTKICIEVGGEQGTVCNQGNVDKTVGQILSSYSSLINDTRRQAYLKVALKSYMSSFFKVKDGQFCNDQTPTIAIFQLLATSIMLGRNESSNTGPKLATPICIGTTAKQFDDTIKLQFSTFNLPAATQAAVLKVIQDFMNANFVVTNGKVCSANNNLMTEVLITNLTNLLTSSSVDQAIITSIVNQIKTMLSS